MSRTDREVARDPVRDLAGPEFEAVIGLECHVQLSTRTKLFSAAGAAFGDAPNTHVDPYTLALPGTLPVLNRAAVEDALRMALAVEATVRKRSRFARKHYFYPDLPKGYQITQHDEPIAEGGFVEFLFEDAPRRVPLIRIHIEEDAGKSVHVTGAAYSLVDLNRAGVPLIEVVSQPALRSPAEAGAYLRALRQLVRYLGICDGNMEEGSLRCDANVSLRPRGQAALGTRTELKNLNSFRHVERALEYEIARQREVLLDGKSVLQETRLWDEGRGSTHPMRGKEQAEDYRYFPEPDLPPLVVDTAWLERVASTQPERPLDRRRRFMADGGQGLGLSAQDADLLTAERDVADYYEQVVAAGADPKRAANWVGSELLREQKRDGRPLSTGPVAPDALAELIALVDGGTLSGKIAKDVLARAYQTGQRPSAIVRAEGLSQIADEGALEALAREVLAAHPRQVEQYATNDKLLGFFVGQLMRRTGGKASPDLANTVLRRLLGGA